MVTTLLEKAEKDTTFQLNGFTFSIANKPHELKSCFSLAYEEYLKKGYVTSENSNHMIISDYDMDKRTMIVMVKNETKDVVGTLTIVLDGVQGLPCDELFSSELTRMRENGSSAAEVVRLAIADEYKNSKEILAGMFNLVCIYTKNVASCTDLLIEVNPRHVMYYQRLLLFKIISEQKECKRVEGAPALLLCLNRTDLFDYYENRNLEKSFLKSLHPQLSKGEDEINLAKMIKREMSLITEDILDKAGVNIHFTCQFV
jgi:hypothetical protein